VTYNNSSQQKIFVSYDDAWLKDLKDIIKRNARIALLSGSIVCLGTWVTALLIFFLKPTYQVQFRILTADPVLSKNNSQNRLEDGAEKVIPTLDASTDMATLAEVLSSTKVLNQIQERLGNIQFDPSKIEIRRPKDSNILNVSYEDNDSVEGLAIAQAIADTYINYSLQQRQLRVKQALQFLNQEYPDVQVRVDRLMLQMQAFKQRHGVTNPSQQADFLRQKLTELELKSADLNAQVYGQLRQTQILGSQLGLSPSAALKEERLSSSSRYQSFINSLSEIDKQLAIDSTRLTNQDPQIKALRSRHEALRQLLSREAGLPQSGKLKIMNLAGGSSSTSSVLSDLRKKYITSAMEVQILNAQAEAANQTVSTVRQRFLRMPELERQFYSLSQQIDAANKSLENFVKAREQLRLDAAQRITPWQLVSPPEVNSTPVSPNLPLSFSLGGILGIITALGTSYWNDKRHTKFRNSTEIEKYLQTPLIGEIPYLEPLESLYLKDSKANILDVLQTETSSNKNSEYLESFKLLLDNLRVGEELKFPQTLAVASAIPGDGKTTVSLSLAHALSEVGKKVLLIDSDLRRPKIHKLTQLKNSAGFNELLDDINLDPSKVIQTVGNHLGIITAGSINTSPARLLNSKRFAQLLDLFKQEYEIILVDVPPLLGMADTSFISRQLDGIILTVGIDKTPKQASALAIEQLKRRGIPVLGVISNYVSKSKFSTYSYSTMSRYYVDYYLSEDPNQESPTPMSINNKKKEPQLSLISDRIKSFLDI
jgi:capsular exopolysaccharide synthesis family protein